MSNLGSNMLLLRVLAPKYSTLQHLKLAWEAVAMGTKYQADTQKRDKLQAQKRIYQKQGKSTRDIDNELMLLNNAIARNPVRETIESGLMPSLVDDVETTFNKTHFPGTLETLTDKAMSKLHPSIQNVGKVAFMTRIQQAISCSIMRSK